MGYLKNKVKDFIITNPKRAQKFMTSKNEEFWTKSGENMALEAFNISKERVRAYQSFLKKQKEFPDNIRSIEDLSKLPILTKDNYLRKYRLNDRCVKDVGDAYILFTTSGTTGGKSVYTATSLEDHRLVPYYVAVFFNSAWDICNPKKKTLLINSLALGTWLAGILVVVVMKEMSKLGNITMINPGADAKKFIDILEDVGDQFDQIIFGCYPTFFKSIVDEGDRRKIDWQKYNLKCVFGGEPVNEKWRKTLIKKFTGKDECTDEVLDMYASTEGTMLGYSTPLTTAIKLLAEKDKKLCKEVFGGEKISPIFQYNPAGVYIEIGEENHIIVTKKSQMPLVRYDTKDSGKIIKYVDVLEILANNGYSLKDLKEKYNFFLEMQWPIIVLKDRVDGCVSLIGANVFPANLDNILYSKDFGFINHIKFQVKYDEKNNPKFIIYVELKKSHPKSGLDIINISKRCEEAFVNELLKVNPDYSDAYKKAPEIASPRIEIYDYKKGPFEADAFSPKPKLIKENYGNI